jgi:choline kinase
MKVIVLAAGQGFQLDGFNKLLLKNPFTGDRIIETYINLFGKENITFILGYRAINVIHNFPNLNYIYNPDWAVYNNSYSLSLALDNNPTIVLSGDLFLKETILDKINCSHENLIISQNNDARSANSINVTFDDNFLVKKVYQGKVENINDFEAMGIYKISDPKLLKSWKNNCLKSRDKFIGLNLDLSISSVYTKIAEDKEIFEINNPDDYLRYRNL